jgi:hypothetical protein
MHMPHSTFHYIRASQKPRDMGVQISCSTLTSQLHAGDNGLEKNTSGDIHAYFFSQKCWITRWKLGEEQFGDACGHNTENTAAWKPKPTAVGENFKPSHL